MLSRAIKNIFLSALTLSFCSLYATSSPEQFHTQANFLRDEGRLFEALNFYNQAIIGYQKDGNYDRILDALCGRLISWQHLYNDEEDATYAIFAKKEAETMLAIANEFQLQSRNYIIHFLLGKSSIFLKDFITAESEFKLAIDLYPSESVEKGDWLAYLGEAMYRNGKKAEGISIIMQGIDYMQCRVIEAEALKVNVWISGAYLRLAKILMIEENIRDAKKYLQLGEEIILKDSRLVVRKRQLEGLKKRLVTRDREIF